MKSNQTGIFDHWQAVSIIVVERAVKMFVTLTTPKSVRR